MKLQEAITLIAPAISPAVGTWADLGAGSGLFTRALASLLGPAGKVLAVDRDAAALAALRSTVRRAPREWARIVPVEADFHDIPAVALVAGGPADGVLLANALHFAPDPEQVIAAVARWLRREGRIVVVEYDGRSANRWVPYPVPVARLHMVAAQACMRSARVVSERPSAYGGIMYCAVLERDAG